MDPEVASGPKDASVNDEHRSTFGPRKPSVEPHKVKPLIRKSKRTRNAAKSVTIAPPPAPTKAAVAVKEITMNRLDFGELIFGGNVKKNLKIESRLNKSVNRAKSKTMRNSPKDTVTALRTEATSKMTFENKHARPLKKHEVKPQADTQLTSVFTKI